MSKHTLTINKLHASEQDWVKVIIRLPDRSITALVSLNDFSHAQFGRADVPCNVKERKGGFHGTNRPNKD